MVHIEEANVDIAIVIARLDDDEMGPFSPQKSAEIKRIRYKSGDLASALIFSPINNPLRTVFNNFKFLNYEKVNLFNRYQYISADAVLYGKHLSNQSFIWDE